MTSVHASCSFIARIATIFLVAMVFLIAQGTRAVGTTKNVCSVQVIAPNACQDCGRGLDDSGQTGHRAGGCCCGHTTACGCELNHGKNGDQQDFATAGYWNGCAQSGQGMVNSQASAIP
ncbi:MAG: hypothetical protein ABIN58_09785, partial [candidate division WOR-3 bacterium]